MEGLNVDDINKYLLHFFNKNNLNLDIIKGNINKIVNDLNNITINTNKHKYLSLSCVFGGFLGDAIGGNSEFFSPSEKNYKAIFNPKNCKRFYPGEITDDSEMAMSAAFAYMDAKSEKDQRIQDLIFFYFGIWKESGPKDMGNTTLNSLKYFSSSCNIKNTKFGPTIQSIIEKANWNSLSNGVLMRISTFIVFYYYTNYDKIDSIINAYFNSSNNNELTSDLMDLFSNIFSGVFSNAKITHPNPEISISASVFCLMVLTGMIRNNAKDIYTLFKTISFSKKFIATTNEDFNHYAKITQKKFVEIIKEIENNKKIFVYHPMGYYMHGFKLSVYFLYKIMKNGEKIYSDLYYNIMCEICNLGGDTDTNCAIVGTMIGPLIGYHNFPKQLFDTFIHYFPTQRTQFTSAFMYIYVNYLEEKYFYKAFFSEKGEEGIFKYPSFVKLFEFSTKKI